MIIMGAIELTVDMLLKQIDELEKENIELKEQNTNLKNELEREQFIHRGENRW